MRSKQEIREHVWRVMAEAGAALFPGAHGRIPNFVGAAQAAQRIASLDVWQQARVLKCNPDMPQQPLRQLALTAGKVIYMAVPRLTSQKCFLELDPERIGNLRLASTIKGAFKVGRPVHPREMRPIDLIVCGSVAVRPDGARLGKGGGFSDLEYAVARALGLVGPHTPIVTTVHRLQVVEEAVPMTRYDIVLDFFATPQELVQCQPAYPKPQGIYWEELGEKLEQVPILQAMLKQSSR